MNSALIDLIESLSTSDPAKLTKLDIDKIRWFIKSDGCTDVPDFYVEECIKHDFYYRTHHDFSGKLIRKQTADLLFRQGIQNKSNLGKFSPLSWERWLFVTILPQAHRAWTAGVSINMLNSI